MKWRDVGEWLKGNAGTGAALVGSLLTGNVPGAVAAGVSLVSSATGHGDPEKALEALQTSPATMLRLKELALEEDKSIREHIRAMEELRLKEFSEQQQTIRSGDNASDEYVRHTRPRMARQSWYGTFLYVSVTEIAKAAGYGEGASLDIAMLLISPAAAYIGFRTWDKFSNKK